jgi:hypothetical protein
MEITRSDCRGNHYCHHWRICERCARIRQAKLAERAEYMELRQGKLALAVWKPDHNTAQAIKNIRDKLVRSKLAPSGIWTIETGELYAGLHLNTIFPARYIEDARHKAAHVEIVRSSARAAAAYIAKRSGMPSVKQYAGRLMGEWGTILQHITASQSQETATVKAAAVNMSMMSKEDLERYGKTYMKKLIELNYPFKGGQQSNEQEQQQRQDRTNAEYAVIARRNLSKLYEAVNLSGRQEPRFNHTTGAKL